MHTQLSDWTRLPFPTALADAAYIACIHEGFASVTLLDEFNRLHRTELTQLAAGPELIEDTLVAVAKLANVPLVEFARFLHRYVYERLPDSAVREMRAATAHAFSHSHAGHDAGGRPPRQRGG